MKPKKRVAVFLAALLVPALSALGRTAADCSSALFVQAAEFPAPDLDSSLATGDFNNDGIPDLVFMQVSGSTAVLIGNGDGSFQLAVTTPTGMSFARFVIAGFFDSDGDLDVAVADGDRIYVELGNGDGTFQPGDLYFTGGDTASGLVAVDLDGDGALDLVESASVGILVLINNGDGTFAPAVSYPTVPFTQSVAAGNLDPDGHPDLAVTFDDGTIGIYPGVGDGSLGAPTFFPVGTGLSAVILADLDGDGPLDLVVGRDRYLDVLHGNGDRTFLAAVEYPIGPGYPASDIRATDLDGDGRLDLAALRFGLGVGTRIETVFQTPSGDFALGGAFEAVAGLFASADFDANGRVDFAVGDNQRDVALVLLTQPDGKLRSAQVTWPGLGAPTSMAGGDFDGDGLDDLVTLSHDPTDTFVVLTRDSRGIFSASGATVTGEHIASDSMVARDFNGDQTTDLAVWTTSGVWVLISNGDGTFQQPVTYVAPPGYPYIAAGDFDGNGRVDLAYGSSVNFPRGVSIFLGNGDGTFQPPLPETPLAKEFRGLAAADLDGSGADDLLALPFVCCVETPQTVDVLLGNGDGTFQDEIEYFAGREPVSIATGDFDGDGHVDVLVADGGASSVALMLGDGAGHLADPVLFGVGAVPAHVIAADFDGDGHLDAATANGGSGNGSSNSLSVLLGTGLGSFQAPALYRTESNPAYPVAGRWSGSALGLAALNIYDYTVTIYSSAQLSAAVSDETVIVGSAAVLEVSASGFGAITYQWRKDGVPLADGGPISGSQTATLTIDPVVFTDAGSYDVVATDSCTNTTSNAATLAVEFDDVPLSNPFHNDILTIATLGITGGCNTGTSYCPSNPVSRAEMAVLLLKAKFGAGHVPPPPPPVPTFVDVPANAFAAAWIEELASLGVTGGCGNGLYCPDAPVTRAEMAVFLLKTLLGSGYVPPDPAGIFADVPPSNFAIAWIEDLYNRGVTAGCATNPLRYCPDTAVPREQMATFLVRTFLGP